MRIYRPLGTLSLAACLMAAEAEAQTIYCGGNHFDTCAAVQISVLPGNVARMTVWNLSGFNGTYASTVFTSIGLFNLPGSVAATSGPLMGLDGSWYEGTIGSPGAWVSGGSNAGGVKSDIQFSTDHGVHDGIANLGCGASDLPGVALWLSGCDPTTGLAGNGVAMQFSYSGEWDGSADLVVQAQSGPDGMSAQCITGDNCEVIPEPITMILLGTGLAGLGGVALRRRRQEDEL
jgi:hypothetical protein